MSQESKPEPRPELLRTRKAINAAFAGVQQKAVLTLRLRQIDHPVWKWGGDSFPDRLADADDAAIDQVMLRMIVERECFEAVVDMIDEHNEVMIRGKDVTRRVVLVRIDDWTIWLAADHIEALHVSPPPPVVKIDGLAHALEFQRDGSIKVGCQVISPSGVEQARKALATYQVTTAKPAAVTATAKPPKKPKKPKR